MEWLFALLATALAATYAVLLGRGIERRKRWALEMARAIAMLHPTTADRHLFEEMKKSEALVRELEREEGGKPDRLAA